jgi:DNA-binding SARP family transcriptional activator/TolB-like protein
MLTIETLGRLSLLWGDREIVLPSRKAKALIGYLALSEAGEETRERLVGLFWSEKEHKDARGSLRQVVRTIRKAFGAVGCTSFIADNDTIGLDPSALKVDVLDVLSTAANGSPHPLMERRQLTDTLLEQTESVDPAFSIWLHAKRQTICNRLTTGLEDALRSREPRPEIQEKIARSLLNLDETHEEAARALIRSRVLAGDMGGALKTYKELWTLLDNEYGVEPSQATQDLIVQLKLSQQPSDDKAASVSYGDIISPEQPMHGPPSAHRRLLSKLTISVASFDTLSVAQESQHVVQGFRKELIASLVRFREWGLRDMTLADPNSSSHQPQPGEYVLEGSAMQDADSIRFVLMLRDMANNEYLWSERVDVSVDNWVQAQQLVVRRISSVLNVHMSVGRMETIANHGVTDWKAFDLWLLGQATLLTYDQKKWDAAAGLFQQVIDKMPDFAPAYSSLAQLNNGRHIAMPGVFRNSDLTDRALTYARRAAQLDPIDSRSQLCLGWSHAMAKKYDQAMVYMPLAYELNENDPWTMISSANCMAFCGEYEQANEIAQHALELPMAPSGLQWSYHVAIRFMCGDYEGCVAAADSVGGVNQNVPAYKVSALYHLGRFEEAQAELANFYDAVRKRWVNDEPASEEAITRWFLTMFPIADPGDWERLRTGLAGAGAPTDGLRHHQW